MGRKLVNIIRFNDVPEQELIDNYYMDPKDFFCCSLGPFLFYFEDGLVIGGVSDSRKNTVYMWVEKKLLFRYIIEPNNIDKFASN